MATTHVSYLVAVWVITLFHHCLTQIGRRDMDPCEAYVEQMGKKAKKPSGAYVNVSAQAIQKHRGSHSNTVNPASVLKWVCSQMSDS